MPRSESAAIERPAVAAAAPARIAAADAFDAILAAIFQGEVLVRALGVCAARPGEGASTVAAELAFRAADAGKRTLLVDADPFAAGQHRRLGVSLAPGLGDLVDEPAAWRSAIQQTARPRLWLLPGGRSWTPRQLCAERLAEILEGLRQEFDWLVFDLPPVGGEGFSPPLVAAMDGLTLVVEAERTAADEVRAAGKALAAAGGHLLGSILNKQRRQLPDWLGRLLSPPG